MLGQNWIDKHNNKWIWPWWCLASFWLHYLFLCGWGKSLNHPRDVFQLFNTVFHTHQSHQHWKATQRRWTFTLMDLIHVQTRWLWKNITTFWSSQSWTRWPFVEIVCVFFTKYHHIQALQFVLEPQSIHQEQSSEAKERAHNQNQIIWQITTTISQNQGPLFELYSDKIVKDVFYRFDLSKWRQYLFHRMNIFFWYMIVY